MLVEYHSDNAIEFFKYSDIYLPSEIRNYVNYLYKGIFYIIGYEIEARPIGYIAVERRNEKNHVCQNFFVLESQRKNGYAAELLDAALKKSAAENVKSFYISFFEGRDWTDSAKTLYAKFGFERSGYVRNTFVLEKGEIKNSIDRMKKRYSRYLKLSGNDRMKRISELTGEEINRIKEELGKEIPYNFNPIVGVADENASLIIFKGDEPVAWIIFEKRGSKILYLHQLYIKEACRQIGLFFPLICKAYDYTPEKVSKYFFYVNGDNSDMLGIFRLFKHSVIKRDRTIEMVKHV